MPSGPAVALVASIAASLNAGATHPPLDAHETGDDARVTVGRDGTADVVHRISWHVAANPLAWFDVAHVSPAAVVDSAVAVFGADGRRLSAHAERRPDGGVRVALDDPQAARRGDFAFELRWREDFLADGALVHDGSTWRLHIVSPPVADGLDDARTVLDLPAAAQEPAPIRADTGASDDAAIATLRRGADRDELELVRPHVARGESADWLVRVDSRALSAARRPAVVPSVAATVAASTRGDGSHPGLVGFALLALGAAWGALVGRKARTFSEACERRGGHARALVPATVVARAVIAGAALAAGVALECAGAVVAGAVCVAASAICASFRAASAPSKTRGPGRWAPVRPEDAFAPRAGADDWLDVGRPGGRRTAVLALLALVCTAGVVGRFDARSAWLVVLSAAPLIPLLLTGVDAQLPPDGAESPAPWLSRVFARLVDTPALDAVPWGRVGLRGDAFDELRLRVVPRVAIGGVVGVEVGLSWRRTTACWRACPEVLARVLDGSPAAAKLARELPSERPVVGRRAEERVYRLAPRSPGCATTVALVRALGVALTERRTGAAASTWTGVERREARRTGMKARAA